MKRSRTWYLVEFSSGYNTSLYFDCKDDAERWLEHKRDKYKAVGEVVKVKECK